MHNVKLQAGTNAHNGTDVGVTSSSQTIAKPRVSRRLSSYEKLKAENKQLKQDIFTLLKKADTMEGQVTKARYLLSYSFSDAVMFGDTSIHSNTFSGNIRGCHKWRLTRSLPQFSAGLKIRFY